MADVTVHMSKALAHMKMASVSVDEWCKYIDDVEAYAYKRTHIYQALKELEAAAAPIFRPPRPPQPTPLKDVQRCLFLTDDISWALDTTNRLLLATADLNYRKYYPWDWIRAAVAPNRFRVWCDCHSTFPDTAFDWLDQLGLPHNYCYGECESAAAFTTGYNAGLRKFVGNLSSLTYDATMPGPDPVTNQLKYVMNGEVHVTNELYLNKDPDATADWRHANAGVGSNCMAVYASSSEGSTYYPLENQAATGKYVPERDCVYVAGFSTGDWSFLVSH